MGGFGVIRVIRGTFRFEKDVLTLPGPFRTPNLRLRPSTFQRIFGRASGARGAEPSLEGR